MVVFALPARGPVYADSDRLRTAVSLLGTFAVMYMLCNFTLDNLSLMAITIATGFVVDDAIVVIENVDALPSNRA